MFNFQGSELIIILLLALVVLGPEKLPDAMRRLGRFYADLKKMSSGFQEEFRAAVDEPARELRETANTLRDSMDFRKLADGERDEKPKSAEMAPADPDAVPTDDVPFQDPDTDDDAATDQDADAPRDEAAAVRRQETERHAAFLNQTSTPPPPPAPFSSSQTISAAAPAAESPAASSSSAPPVDAADEPAATPSGDPSSNGNGDETTIRRIAPQVAVDDEHGLREARPADQDGAA